MPEVRVRKRLILRRRDLPRRRPVAATPQRRARSPRRHSQSFAGAYVEQIEELHGRPEATRPRDGASRWSPRSAATHKPLKAMAKAQSSAPPANSNTARSGTFPAGTRCARSSAARRRSWLPQKKLEAPGTRLDVPITHINASYVRSHFDCHGSRHCRCPARRRNLARARNDDRARAFTRG